MFLQKKRKALSMKKVKRENCRMVMIHTFLILMIERELRDMKTPTW